MVSVFDKSILAFLFLLLFVPLSSYSANANIENGRRIYMEGVLPSGDILKGTRSGEEFSGKQAACVTCHRPSGMGTVEGDIQVPPITGNYLYRSGDSLLNTMDPRSGKRFNQAHEPYTDATVADAIRRGVNVGGQQMSVLMPRYELNDNELRDLTAYLKQLSQVYSPGATKDELHFATVITPDVNPERRRILLKVLERGFKQKNGSTALTSRKSGRRHMVTAAEMVLGTERNWVLHVWDLKGAPETWRAQLDDYYRKEPVFALFSGLSGSTWQPVHEFAEQTHIPCWFPSVDIAEDSKENFYSIYFQRGVKLEAVVLAKYIAAEAKLSPRRIIQIYHDDALGKGASTALTEAFKNTSINIENRPLPQTEPLALNDLLKGLDEQDAVMLWLSSEDLQLLDGIPAPKSSIYISGRLSGAEKTLMAPAWKKVAKMVYPYELPEKRQVNLNYFHRWARFNQIPMEDEPLQAEAYFALEFLTETMTELLDNLYRDYLVERAESMLSRSQTSNSEIRDRTRQVMRWSTRMPRGTVQQAAKVDASDAGKEKAIPGSNYAETPSKGTTIYPRMSLGVSQRFASKGAYVVRFEDTAKTSLIPLSSWIIP